ncbi:type II secretion system protein [Candidatus Uhrbacteria bacterium]|nr:type II secretion system protein [Candidatus Uhrbacteria bacterium]
MLSSFRRAARAGFTLIELLVVIGIIAILAVVVFVALDPATRFEDARDTVRQSDVQEILSAVKIDQVDNSGAYATDIAATTAGQVYMIGTATTGCNATCETAVSSATNCVDLAELVTDGYLAEVPVSPNGTGTWGATLSGYTLQRDATGILTIRACESENTDEIEVAR